MKNVMIMEKTNSHLLFLLSISSLLFLSFPGSTNCEVQPPAPPPAVDSAIDQMCQQTSFPSVCISTLAPFSSQTNSSTTAMLETALNATLNLTEAALANATRLLSDQSKPSSELEKIGIERCQQYYNWAVQDLQKAVQAVADGDTGTFSSSVKEAIKTYWGCEQSNTDSDMYGELYYILGYALPINHSPFKDVDWQLTQMATNCLDINTAIEWSSY